MAINLNQNEILKFLKEWKENGNIEALEILIENYSGIVKTYAKRFSTKGLPKKDLESAGNLGLINALNLFDYNESSITTITSFVKKNILVSINEEIEDYIKYSKDLLYFNDKISTGKSGKKDKIKNLVFSTDYSDETSDKYDKLYKGFKTLTKREKEILMLRFGLEEDKLKSQEELAEIYGCTKEEVDLDEKKALKKMRNQNGNN